MRLNYIVLDATTGQNALSQVDLFNEAIDIEEYPIDEAVSMVLSGKIEDGKSQAGILMANEILRR